MLSSGMREDTTSRIELPGKDPEEWKEFYKIIDPSQIGVVKTESSIDENNAIMLTPWFHEFSMEAHLKQCDDVLSAKTQEISQWDDFQTGKLKTRFWAGISDPGYRGSVERRRECFRKLLDLLQHACKYDLSQTKHEVELTLGSIMKHNLRHCLPLFDVDAIRELIQLCLPVSNENLRLHSSGRLISSGPCSNLWEKHLSGFLSPQTRANVTADMINGNEMFPLLLHSYMQQFVLKERNDASERHRMYVEGRDMENRTNAWHRVRPDRFRFDPDPLLHVPERIRLGDRARELRERIRDRHRRELGDSSSSSDDSEGELARAPPPEDSNDSDSDSDSSSSERNGRNNQREALNNSDDEDSSQDSDRSDSDRDAVDYGIYRE
jgi:hypothetical protein